MFELTVILKDTERTYKETFLCYEAIEISHDSKEILDFIEKAKQSFKPTVESVQIKISMHLK